MIPEAFLARGRGSAVRFKRFERRLHKSRYTLGKVNGMKARDAFFSRGQWIAAHGE